MRIIWKLCSFTYSKYDGLKIYFWIKLKEYHQFWFYLDCRIDHTSYKNSKDIPSIVNI